MKTKPSMGGLKEGNSLYVCRQSTKISKSSHFQVKGSPQEAVLDTSDQNHLDVASSNVIVSDDDNENADEIECEDSLDGATLQIQKSLSSSFDSSLGRSGTLPATCSSFLGTIFSPIFELSEGHPNPINHSTDDSDDGSSSLSDHQTCNVSDFCISEMSMVGYPFDENARLENISTGNAYLDYQCIDRHMVFDVAEGYMVLPFLEEAVETSNFPDGESVEETSVRSDDACLYLALQQMKPSDENADVNYHSGDLDEVDDFDPHTFIRNLPDLSEVAPSLWPTLLPKEEQKRNLITLVLDLDETLVHSTLEPCDDADFTFPVYFNMKEHIVYVRQRPYLQIFLERVAEMFEIVVFTASQSIYAEHLLNVLDPDKKLISRRVYRESCIFSDGGYVKDLTVLGLDLAKVFIIDNSPQVFQLQVNNGIPIKSWFDDPSDSALISLLPFLETLVDVDDVRPIIAKRFNNTE